MSTFRISTTILLMLIAPAVLFAKRKDKSLASADKYYIIIDKSDNTLTVYDARDWVVQYPCTFGNTDLGDKMVEGDRKTPIGVFHILAKNIHAKWDRFMALDYPTKADYAKFNQRKASGLIPQNAKIGGSIGIHGTWPHEEWAVENLQAWTQGCISMKNEDVEELYGMVSVGTRVIIQK